jgi:hypothetical protein
VHAARHTWNEAEGVKKFLQNVSLSPLNAVISNEGLLSLEWEPPCAAPALSILTYCHTIMSNTFPFH